MTSLQHHILHLEDNHDDALLIQRVLRKLDPAASIGWVEDGAQALSYLRGEEKFSDRHAHPLPTLALLDIKVPRYTGLEVLEWIRSHKQFSSLPVIMFSSSRNLEDIRRAYDLGTNAYLVKGVGYEELQETLRAVVNFWLQKNILPF